MRIANDFWSDERFWERPELAVGADGRVDLNKLQPVIWFRPHRGLTVDSEGRYNLNDNGFARRVDTLVAARVLGVGEPHLRFWVVRYQLRRALVQSRAAVLRRRQSLPVHRGVRRIMDRSAVEHSKWLEWQMQMTEERGAGWWHGE